MAEAGLVFIHSLSILCALTSVAAELRRNRVGWVKWSRSIASQEAARERIHYTREF